MLVSTPTPRFVVHGTQGGYLKFGLDPQEEALKRGETVGGEFWGYEAPERWGTLLKAQGDVFIADKCATEPGDYRKFYANVRDAMLGTAELAVTPQQALRVRSALEMAAESSRKGCVLPWRS